MVPSRRAFLYGAGVAVASSLAGCAGVGLGDSPQLGQLGVTNYDTQSHVVHVLLLEGDEPAYWTSKRVPAAEGDVLGTAVFEGDPAGVEPNRLLTRLDGQSLSAADRFDFAEYEADCLGLQIEIGDESRPPELSIWYTAGPDPCETTETTE
ncbi:hypothetical protein [Haloplanus aerogenes]|uniref:Uncharacterized protein n=1 Tax=Haloplanus aerogenes TaxID=660522 RepID=A0A3M0DU97_9EURY|nr:hypothetical protein [Haloplanus aerogenes]AZH25865.1 hypothetical protein DU502_10965 [Haloplanus aerogenes]RMB25614.1 hypothetical protein ATH50_0711 [Haloplanus aerogenes]